MDVTDNSSYVLYYFACVSRFGGWHERNGMGEYWMRCFLFFNAGTPLTHFTPLNLHC